MPAPAPHARPRPSGGFNQGFGNFNDSFEHIDDQAMQSAVQQKALGQSGTSSTQSATGGSALGSKPPLSGPAAQTTAPRPMGSLTDELILRPAQDIGKGLLSLFDLNSLLGVNAEKDDPQTQAKKKQMLQRWNQLNEEDQAQVKKRYQEEMQKKQQAEQAEQAKKQQAEQAKAQQVVVPSSPKNGPIGPSGSGRNRAVNKLEQDRKTLGGPKGSN